MAEQQESSTTQPGAASFGETWTITKILSWVAEDFRGRGIASPRLEAEVLLCHALNCERIHLVLDRDRPLSEGELARFRKLVLRRRKREPLAYLCGHREFFGHRFELNSDVLIPRQDTETLVEVALARTSARSLFGHALDLCTGSGNVALSFAKERPTWRVVASDISTEALRVAGVNAKRLGTLWNVRLAQADLFEGLPSLPSCYDLIVSNPPYIRSAEIVDLAPEIRDYEPRIALDGGPDGLVIVRRLVQDAGCRLTEQGVLALEVGFDETEETAQLLAQGGFDDVRVDKDLGGRPRVVSGVRPRLCTLFG